MRLAAIDIGSNAVRLLITDVIAGPQGTSEFIKTALVRVPLRQGFDVFDKGEISAGKVEKIIKTIKSYKLLLDVYEVKHLKACATSAMRDAANSAEIIKKVKTETGIDIEIISIQNVHPVLAPLVMQWGHTVRFDNEWDVESSRN